DGTPLPNNVLVERVCNNRVRQQLYASPHGDFSMQLGSRADSFVDASGDPGPQSGAARKDSDMGIPRRELANCELRASASGFYPSVMNLVGDLVTLGASVDVGAIVVQRAAKIEGDRKSTRLNSCHVKISYAVFCLKKKKKTCLHQLLCLQTFDQT